MDAVAKMHDYGMKLWQESIHMLLRQSPRIVLGAELIALEKKGTIFTENYRNVMPTENEICFLVKKGTDLSHFAPKSKQKFEFIFLF